MFFAVLKWAGLVIMESAMFLQYPRMDKLNSGSSRLSFYTGCTGAPNFVI